ASAGLPSWTVQRVVEALGQLATPITLGVELVPLEAGELDIEALFHEGCQQVGGQPAFRFEILVAPHSIGLAIRSRKADDFCRWWGILMGRCSGHCVGTFPEAVSVSTPGGFAFTPRWALSNVRSNPRRRQV